MFPKPCVLRQRLLLEGAGYSIFLKELCLFTVCLFTCVLSKRLLWEGAGYSSFLKELSLFTVCLFTWHSSCSLLAFRVPSNRPLQTGTQTGHQGKSDPSLLNNHWFSRVYSKLCWHIFNKMAQTLCFVWSLSGNTLPSVLYIWSGVLWVGQLE